MSLNDPIEPVHAPATPALAPEAEADAGRRSGLPSRFCCFVTGTDTEIGKTLVSAAILHKLVAGGVRACGMKPVAAGAEMRDGELHNEDADMLTAAGNVHLPANITTPYMLRDAVRAAHRRSAGGRHDRAGADHRRLCRNRRRRPTRSWSKAWAASACRSRTISTAPTWPRS